MSELQTKESHMPPDETAAPADQAADAAQPADQSSNPIVGALNTIGEHATDLLKQLEDFGRTHGITPALEEIGNKASEALKGLGKLVDAHGVSRSLVPKSQVLAGESPNAPLSSDSKPDAPAEAAQS